MTSPASHPVDAAQRAGSPRSHQARGTPDAVLDPAIWLVIERAAALPRGLALLHRAPLECVAVRLATHPQCISRARAALEDGAKRAAVLGRFAWAAHQGGRAPAMAEAGAPRPRSPEELMRAADERAGGVAMLASASIEYAAIVFGVHPDLVLAARELVARRGVPVALADDA